MTNLWTMHTIELKSKVKTNLKPNYSLLKYKKFLFSSIFLTHIKLTLTSYRNQTMDSLLTKIQANLVWLRTVGAPRSLGGIAKLDTNQEQLTWHIFNNFMKTLSDNIWHMSFEEMIKFAELWPKSFLNEKIK